MAFSRETEQENRRLAGFWSQAIALSEEDREQARRDGPEGWKEMAPSEKLFRAAASLGGCKKVLDYGCGNAWAGIIAAKSGCPDVTAADVASGAIDTARFYAELYGADKQVRAVSVGPDWLQSVPAGAYDGIVCSNVLDVVPPETAAGIIRGLAKASAAGAGVIIGLNYYLSAEAAARRGLELADGNRLYMDGVLRLVSRKDEEWEQLFAPFFTVERLEYFAWPGEAAETRRLFRLRRRET